MNNSQTTITMVLGFLGVAALTSLGLAGYLAATGNAIPDFLVATGSSCIGALAGILAKTGNDPGAGE
jgi:hypothetical protein